jgi:hypothetical protein
MALVSIPGLKDSLSDAPSTSADRAERSYPRNLSSGYDAYGLFGIIFFLEARVIAMKDFSYCNRCKSENEIGLKQCPNCGGRLVSSKKIRVMGVLLIVTGLFLCIMMGGLSIFFAGVILHAGEKGHHSFTGTPQQPAIIFGFFGVIFAIGLTSLVGGIWQIKTGKRNLKIQIATFILVALVIVGYWLIQAFIPHT